MAVDSKRAKHVTIRVARVVFDGNPASVARSTDCNAFIRGGVYGPKYRPLL